jgi:acetyl esterase/lipase
VSQLLRHVEARPRPEHALIFNGPGVQVDPGTMEMFAGRWEPALGLSIRVAAASSAGSAAAELTAALEGIDVAVVNPGTADLVEAVPPNILAAFVGFSYPGLATARFDRGPLEDIAGRALDGYRWALKYLIACCEWPFAIYRYGEERDQVAELRLPEAPGPHPAVVIIHGGGWKALWRKDIMAPMAVDLARRGYATWNIDFRRLGCGGGWPTTFDDVAAAIDALGELVEPARLDRDRVAFVGHSSGGQLALWAAAPGNTRLRPAAVVSLAGVVDLAEGAKRELIGGENVVAKLLGGSPEEVPERYAAVSPRALLPIGIPQVLVQGLSDYILDLVDQNRVYAREAATLGDTVRLIEIEGAEHLHLIEPTAAGWPTVVDSIQEAFLLAAT